MALNHRLRDLPARLDESALLNHFMISEKPTREYSECPLASNPYPLTLNKNTINIHTFLKKTLYLHREL